MMLGAVSLPSGAVLTEPSPSTSAARSGSPVIVASGPTPGSARIAAGSASTSGWSAARDVRSPDVASASNGLLRSTVSEAI